MTNVFLPDRLADTGFLATDTANTFQYKINVVRKNIILTVNIFLSQVLKKVLSDVPASLPASAAIQRDL